MLYLVFLVIYLLWRCRQAVRVGTHSGKFHFDEVTSVTIIKRLCDVDVVIRSRNKEVHATCDILVDVGGVYNPDFLRFDHHQGGAGFNVNGIPKSSAGLVWDHFGPRVVKEYMRPPTSRRMWFIRAALTLALVILMFVMETCDVPLMLLPISCMFVLIVHWLISTRDEYQPDPATVAAVVDRVREVFIVPIDAKDNGKLNRLLELERRKPAHTRVDFLVGEASFAILNGLNLTDISNTSNQDKQFALAVEMVGPLLDAALFNAVQYVQEYNAELKHVDSAFDFLENHVLHLQRFNPMAKKAILAHKLGEQVWFAVWEEQMDDKTQWRIVTVNDGISRGRLPTQEDARAEFCNSIWIHSGRWTGGAPTKDKIMEVAKLAVQNAPLDALKLRKVALDAQYNKVSHAHSRIGAERAFTESCLEYEYERQRIGTCLKDILGESCLHDDPRFKPQVITEYNDKTYFEPLMKLICLVVHFTKVLKGNELSADWYAANKEVLGCLLDDVQFLVRDPEIQLRVRAFHIHAGDAIKFLCDSIGLDVERDLLFPKSGLRPSAALRAFAARRYACDAGLRPSEAGLRPSEAGLRPSEAGLRPSEAGLSIFHKTIFNVGLPLECKHD
jgi:uncharacterized UPF0160 family protein